MKITKNKIKMFLEGISASGLASISGTLWKMGGAGNYSRYWRRIGVALVLTGQSYWFTRSLFSLITIPLAFASYTLGYGVPDHTDPEPSDIGKFWCKILKIDYTKPYSEKQMNTLRFLIRATVGLAYSLSYIPTAILLKHYIGLIIGMIFLTLIIPAICHFRLTNTKEETLIGSTILIGLGLVKLIAF